MPNSPFYKVIVNEAVLVMTLDPWVELNRNAEMKDAIPTEAGWFKLECSFPMDPRLVLVIYRHRVSIEYTISVLKSVINLDPMRVWNSDAIRGKLVIGMINQFLITNLIRDLEPRTERRIIDGKPVDVRIRPSEKLVVKTLGRYEGVAESYEWGGFRVEGLPDPGLTEEIAKVFDRYDEEGAISIPEDLVWMTDPTAQWGGGEKNSQDMAMSIAQYFAESIFPEFMGRRCHWKDVDPHSLGVFEPSLAIDPESQGARSLENVEITRSRIEEVHVKKRKLRNGRHPKA